MSMDVQFCTRPGPVPAGIYKNRRGGLTARDVGWHFGSHAEVCFLQSCKNKNCISRGFRSVSGFRYFIPGEMGRLKNTAHSGVISLEIVVVP